MQDLQELKIGKGGWGQHIELSDKRGWWRGNVWGHMTPRPQEGQKVSLEMKSGIIYTGRLVEVKRCHDPADMFFAKVEWDDPQLKAEIDRELAGEQGGAAAAAPNIWSRLMERFKRH